MLTEKKSNIHTPNKQGKQYLALKELSQAGNFSKHNVDVLLDYAPIF